VRILYGIENLPRDPSNPRLPSVSVGPAKLRLNSVPLPTDLAPVEPTHEARRTALGAWLLAQCGDYARDRRRFVTAYLDWAEQEITSHRAAIEAQLARFDGLYRPEDFFWSAPRPLPRAWLPDGAGWARADIAFWDGTEALRIDASADVAAQMPPAFQRFWEGEILPTSPFRRPWPDFAPG
jgi:hypothetical protein